jgi:hypothetical protein
MADKLNPLVNWGLFLAWLSNDIEELATMVDTSEQFEALFAESQIPAIKKLAPFARRTQRETNLEIAAVGLAMLIASVLGARTDGRSKVFQSALNGLQAHVASHVGLSVVLRGYSSGVVTAVLSVLPYTVWARRRLRERGVLEEGVWPYARALAFLPAFGLLFRAVQGRRWDAAR